MKKSKDSPLSNCYDPRSSSATPVPPSGPMTNHHHHHQYPPSVVMPIVRKPNYYQNLTPEQQASIKMQLSPPTSGNPCRLPCCYPPSMSQQQQQQCHPSPNDKSYSHERMIYREYSIPTPSPTPNIKRDPCQTPDPINNSSSINRKQRRLDTLPPSSTPYPSYSPGKNYFVPPPPPPSNSPWTSTPPSNNTPYANMKPTVRYPYPSPTAPPPSSSSSSTHPPMNGIPRKVDPYPSPQRPTPVPARGVPTGTPFVPQTSSTLISPPNTPHELTLPNVRPRMIDLQRAMIERGYCDVDKIPKLVIRHVKTYANRTVETMGQLFPAWFNEPDYRCIHCFRCDQVFTPQQFMTHVDDEQMQNEQPINMTSIQLLTSEKMSEYKVGL